MIHFALDLCDNRIYIENAQADETYYCECCHARLIPKKGNKRAHHFAHYFDENPTDEQLACKNLFEARTANEMSKWHHSWQDKFPLEQREVILKNANGERRRADIYIKELNTVIEFQHSFLKPSEFQSRNHFYNDLGISIIWVYDFTSLCSGKMKYLDSKYYSNFDRQYARGQAVYKIDNDHFVSLFADWSPKYYNNNSIGNRVTLLFTWSQREFTFYHRARMITKPYANRRTIFTDRITEQGIINPRYSHYIY